MSGHLGEAVRILGDHGNEVVNLAAVVDRDETLLFADTRPRARHGEGADNVLSEQDRRLCRPDEGPHLRRRVPSHLNLVHDGQAPGSRCPRFPGLFPLL